MLDELDELDIGIDDFFKLERNVTFKFAALVHDVNLLQKEILGDNIDVSPFVSKVSHAFLPSAVYQLEEYGLPRMISRALSKSHIIDLENQELTLHLAIEKFNELGKELILNLSIWDEFDKYIIDYFYDGITVEG